MKKTEYACVPGTVLLAPALGDGALPREAFERNARAFLKSDLSASLFLEICNAVLENPYGSQCPDYEKMVHKYRYLTLMAMERYYEAAADAMVMLNVFDDLMLHCQMMCTVSLRRRRYRRALEYMDTIMTLAREQGGDPAEFATERGALVTFIETVTRVNARDLCREFRDNSTERSRAYAGRPLEISGNAHYIEHPETHSLFVIFEQPEEVMRGIYCKLHKSEFPFLRHTDFDQPVTVFGYVLGVDREKILMQPCTVVS